MTNGGRWSLVSSRVKLFEMRVWTKEGKRIGGKGA